MPEVIEPLKEALRDRQIVPFVGAGVSRAVLGTDGEPLFPGWSKLLIRAAERLRRAGKPHEANVVEGLIYKSSPDYLQAAAQAREGLGPFWYKLLADTFNRDDYQPDSLALAKAIWKLPSELIVTTNYDSVLRWAHKNPGGLRELRIDPGPELADMLRQGVKKPTVWHLHGHIDDVEKMILTPDGYRELYPEGDGEAGKARFQPALTALRHLLVARSFLFIGFSLEDTRFGDQINWVSHTFNGAAGPHYLLVKKSELHETKLRLKGLPDVWFLPFEDFGKPLIECIEQLADEGHGGRRSNPAPIAIGAGRAAAMPAPLAVAAGGAAALLHEVRSGYRCIYEHQRKLFDRLTELSDALHDSELEFERWDPNHYSRPARSTTEFFRRPYWAWDFLPAFALELSWQSPGNRKAGVRRAVIEIETDGGFPTGIGHEPAPSEFKLPVTAPSELWVGQFRSRGPAGDLGAAWELLSERPSDELYNGTNYTVTINGEKWTYRAIRVDLGEVMERDPFREKVIVPVCSWFDVID